MFEEISRFRGFCDWLIGYTHCPCNRAAPDPVACLGAYGVDVAPRILRPKPRPRASARRRRSRRTALGKSADPDGPSRSSIAVSARPPPCRGGSPTHVFNPVQVDRGFSR